MESANVQLRNGVTVARSGLVREVFRPNGHNKVDGGKDEDRDGRTRKHERSEC